MERRKLLILIPFMYIGGVEKALLSLLNVLPKEKFEIDLILDNVEGELLEYIPQNVKITTMPYKDIAKGFGSFGIGGLIKKLLKEKSFLNLIMFCSATFVMKIFKNDGPMKKFLFGNYKISKQYDLAFNFPGPVHSTSIFIEQIANAKKKFIWMHTDSRGSNNSSKKFKYRYEKYDAIFGVSQACVDQFTEKIPNFKEKTHALYNVIPQNLIQKLSKEYNAFNDDFDGLRIVTVGRVSYEKGYDVAIQVFKKVIEDGYNVKWYIIGDGNEKENILNLIKKNNLEHKFVLLGAKKNPYPYISQCDIYVQPSRFEAYSLTVAEARVLNKPIVCTNFSGSKEQIKSDITGIIVNLDINEIYNAIVYLLRDKNLRTFFTNNLSKENVDTTSEIYKLYNLII